MNSVKITPLGVFYVSLAVGLWNNSKQLELKDAIKRLFLSENAVLVSEGFEDLHKLMSKDHVFMRAGSPQALATPHDVLSLLSLVLNPVASADDALPKRLARAEALNLAKRDVLFYFAAMFKDGHFENIPVPEFEYASG